MKDKVLFGLFLLFPKNYLSFIFGKIANIKKPKILVDFILKRFISFYKIDISEIEKDVEEYESLGEFFNRDLKEGARKIGGNFISPVDAFLRNVGEIKDLSIEVLKGKTYSLNKLLASSEDAKKYEDGVFINLYLSPKDYHNVHSPLNGILTSIRYIPGNLWPVTDWSLRSVKDLFSINERLVFNIESELGDLSLVMVGATNVGKMTNKFLNFTTNNLKDRKIAEFKINKKINIFEKIASFKLGSTVVLVLDNKFRDKIDFDKRGRIYFGKKLLK